MAAPGGSETRRKHERTTHGPVATTGATAGSKRLITHPVCDLATAIDHLDSEHRRGGHLCPHPTTRKQDLSQRDNAAVSAHRSPSLRRSSRGVSLEAGGLNVPHSHPDAAAIKSDKQARNTTTATKCQLQDAVSVPETSSEKRA